MQQTAFRRGFDKKKPFQHKQGGRAERRIMHAFEDRPVDAQLCLLNVANPREAQTEDSHFNPEKGRTMHDVSPPVVQADGSSAT